MTVTLTESTLVDANPLLSLTVSVNFSTVPVVPTCGAVKVGLVAVVLLRLTVGPAVCDHAYVSGTFPSGSVLPLPSSVTGIPSFIVSSGPALAAGELFVIEDELASLLPPPPPSELEPVDEDELASLLFFADSCTSVAVLLAIVSFIDSVESTCS